MSREIQDIDTPDPLPVVTIGREVPVDADLTNRLQWSILVAQVNK